MSEASPISFEPYTPPDLCAAEQPLVCVLPKGHDEPHLWEGDALLCKRCDCWSAHPWFWRVVWSPVFAVQLRLANTRLFHRLFWTVGKRPANRKWWIRWLNVPYDYCPQCGIGVDCGQPPWFTFTGGGSYDNFETGKIYWFEGIQTCPRCLHEWEYGDSS